MTGKLKDIPVALTFDDVVMVPKYSTVPSRKTPDVSVDLAGVKLKIPIISSPMNTVTEWKMMEAMSSLGGTSVLHRYMSSDDQLQECLKALRAGARDFFTAVGATGDFLERAYRLYDTLGLIHFCVDVANGHSEVCLKAVDALVGKIPKAVVMAGNVCSYEGTKRLSGAGASIIRVGVGPGSMCKTRVVTGHGVPQLSALEDCLRAKDPNVFIVADGGIRNSGDIVKALAIGADAVMLGGLLAGTEETPGPIHLSHLPGQKYKKYAGMASEEGRAFNGWFTETKSSFIPEGESTEVPYKGPVKDVVEKLVGGLQSGMSYSGAYNLEHLRKNAEWRRITDNGRVEGTPHGK